MRALCSDVKPRAVEPITLLPHYVVMIHAMNRTLLTACSLLFLANAAAQAGVKEDLNRAMGQFNRDICRTFELKRCRAAPSSRQKPASAARQPAAASKKAKPASTRLTPAQVPVPRQKPPHNSPAPKSKRKLNRQRRRRLLPILTFLCHAPSRSFLRISQPVNRGTPLSSPTSQYMTPSPHRPHPPIRIANSASVNSP